MKKRVRPAVILILVLILSVITGSCKKEKIPDYPELIGSWNGNTSQGLTMTVYVDNVKGTLYVESFKLSVYTSAGIQEYQNSNSSGLAALADRTFRINIGSGYIEGTFTLSDMSLSGNFGVYASGNNVDLITGTYLAYKK